VTIAERQQHDKMRVMKIDELLKQSRDIWGNEKLALSQIIVRIGKVL
jgi:uncharacterized protein (DUF2384 family)